MGPSATGQSVRELRCEQIKVSLVSRLNPVDLNERTLTWNKLSNLLSTYETLYLTDQVFLVEALEHVQFGQLSAAANVVQKLTRDSLDPQHK